MKTMPLDRIINLRLASKSENAFNSKTRSDNTSGHRGVSFDAARNKWMVRLDRKFIGRYNSLDEATKIASLLHT